MKKSFTLILTFLLALQLSAQNQGKAIIELFIWSNAPEYDSILKIMDQGNYDFVAYHDNRNDTLECKDVVKLMDERRTFIRPCAYVNGHSIENYQFLDPEIYQQTTTRTELYNDKLIVQALWTPGNPTLKIKAICYNASNTHLMAMITESFPGTKYRNILRSLVFDTLFTGQEISRSITIQPNWNPENCKLLVINETTHGQILSCKFTDFRENILAVNTHEITTSIFPNPAYSSITIQSDQPLQYFKIISQNVVLIDSKITTETQLLYSVSTLQPGYYFILTKNKISKFLKL